MPEREELRKALEACKETVRVLQAENASLIDRAEETILLSLIAEELESAPDAAEVLVRGLERISILKDVPLCAACIVENESAVVVQAFYQYGNVELDGAPVSLAPAVAEDLALGCGTFIRGEECAQVGLPVDVSGEFAPRSILLMPLEGGANGLVDTFVFADDRDDERLRSMSIMLHRVAAMMVAKMHSLDLLVELRELNSALASATKAKSDFLANMSHEIRTPMNAILGFAQLLRRDPDLTPQQAERLDIINRSGEHLMAIINDVLEMSKIEAGRLVANTAAFDLYDLLGDVETMFGARASAKGLRLEVDRAQDLPREIVSDRAKVHQVLINLLGNALKFTDEGSVMLRVRCVRAEECDSKIVFEVEDTGVGMAPEELGALFMQFQQTRSGRELGSGTGLGLAISREYVRLLGGAISVRSERGVGSTFTFDIGCQSAESPGSGTGVGERHVTGLAPDQPRFRVLVADDYGDMLALVVQMLTELGFDAMAVSDGQQAVTAFSEWAPDVILMDMRMPVMDGFEAIEHIRASEGGTDVKIVVLTASAFSDTREQVLARGADGYITKPFTESELLGTLGELIGAEYVSASAGAAAPSRDRSGLPSPSPTLTLPSDLRGRLREATTRGDFDAVIDLTAEVEAYDPVLAKGIRELAASFDAELLLDILGRQGP